MVYLQRFLNAQELFYEQAIREIKAGKKEGHWIWQRLKGNFMQGDLDFN